MKPLLLILIAALLATTAPTLAKSTARASGVLAVHAGPGEYFPIIDKLGRNERVYLSQCTKKSRWCLAVQLDGGPDGWVDGSYLIGSGAKNAVTPFEFSFDPMRPGGLRRPL
jgi:uncharacterized protein YraI